MKKNKRKVIGILLTLCMLLSSLTVFADSVNPIGHTLYQYSQSEEMIQWFEENKSELLEEHKRKYPTESGWWDEYVIVPSLTGVISGYPDGTIRPNNPVTGGEFAKMVATAFEGYIQPGGRLDSTFFDGKWYNNYYNAIAKAFPYYNSTFLIGSTTEDSLMELPIKRSEVAYVLASIIDKNCLNDYIKKIKSNDISTMQGYVDFSQRVFTGTEYINERGYNSTLQDWKWSCVNELRSLHGLMPQNQAAAIMMLKDLGVMIGDGEGHINPLDNVTRAEVFKLIQTTCENTPSYTKNKFYGWETKPSSGGSSTSTTQMTEETVLNPSAPVEYQYKVKDINESSYKYILNGKANIAEKQLSKEYTKPIVDKVKESVVFKDGYTEITIPDIKSDYHEVYVIYDINENGTWAGREIYTSTKGSGTLQLSGKCYGITIGIRGREDKASIKSKAASSSCLWMYSVEQGAWEMY